MHNYSSSTDEPHDIPLSEGLLETRATILAIPTPTLSHSRGISSSNSQHASKDEVNDQNNSVPLQRSVYMVFLVLLYGVAAIYAWAIICILTYRPIGGTYYGMDELNEIPEDYSYVPTEDLAIFFARSEKYLRAARIVQSLVSVVTIPLTSAVCSQAAVVYIQRKRGKNSPTLRQSMALADKGWMDIAMLKKLAFGGWRKHMSSLLLFALLLHLLGGAISPVQQLFLSYETIKRIDSEPIKLEPITQLSDLFPEPHNLKSEQLDIVELRSALTSVDNIKVQTRLWTPNNGIVTLKDRHEDGGPTSFAALSSPFQTKSQNTLANMSSMTDPFWAQLPASTNTGLRRQFAPRLNSTAKWENISAAVLPADCNSLSDALYFHYEYDGELQYNIEICMPGDTSISPWKNQNSRQDISEELYLKMDFSGEYIGTFGTVANVKSYSTRLTVNTTSGIFELPNYANGQMPGPLSEGDPSPKDTRSLHARSLENDTAWNTFTASQDATNVRNIGPLKSIALALFGEASFADINHTVLAAYAHSNVPYGGCIGKVPFLSLLSTESSFEEELPVGFDRCLTAFSVQYDHYSYEDWKNTGLHKTVASYFWLFSGDPLGPSIPRLENAFSVAAFLANDVMMTKDRDGSLYIDYAMGTDQQVPQISRAGIIFVSVLLGVDLLCLLALALYSAWIPRWTGTLDSFAMLRIGASISDKTPLLATQHVEGIKILDETPGWIGNNSDGKVGELCLGGERPLRKGERYVGYDTNDMVLTRYDKFVRWVLSYSYVFGL
ncbi:hypothetical protein N7463_010640 [Penicillium fimorum]|uniref:Uncharacterized protein n=1 Tax=Penicillium fimorum TaxID=1882269 RepID=A0A9W9XKA8_9EURO|nr:hypothetical protein N7463_010640 [Penicillium fimorum]